jgi:hypothetical protein
VGSREASRLSETCRAVVIGTILGDGCLERNGRNVRLRIDHGASQHELVHWKLKQLQELNPLAPRLVQRVDRRTGRLHSNIRFETRTTAALNDYFDVFYGADGVKRVPDYIWWLLTSPLSLAVWYMDDGGKRGDCRSGYLNTNAYSVEDVALLQACLARSFGIKTRTHFAAGKPRIYVPAAQFERFCEVVRPDVIPAMTYKLL